ncbi:hypothetical protein EHQ53_06435 [Leptospira langatensis]|uniref:Uncharacterized protein n=1 Tax=Leptospira langatensis TaxID=2484983 RepID=A0A5F1ZTR9_9LEPT|nr:hypothetical protein [Leptospira langatensis]TGK03084.1 hypothetical protein EHO57_07270 [Leptospira langatensis]TGL41840.1 hypothetical protein EHQ53_06435 [Leptospira langatensis]
MPEFDQIDLFNYAAYGSEDDPEWDDIRNYIRSNSSASKEYEEIKRNLSNVQPKRKQRDYGRPNRMETNSPGSEPNSPKQGDQDKKWWSVFLGE